MSLLQATRYDVVMQGTAYCDLTFAFSEGDELPQLGQEAYAERFAINPGGVFILAAALTRLGVRVGWRTAVGNDLFGLYIAEQMAVAGLTSALTTYLDAPMPVVTAGVSFPHDRLYISHHSPWPAGRAEPRLTVSDLDEFEPRVLFTYGEVGLDVMRAARERGIVVYVDAYWNPEHLHSSALRQVIAHADVFCPNLLEALAITGAASGPEARTLLQMWCPQGAITGGVTGCLAWDRGGLFEVPALPLTSIDSTGAGDNFNAGFIFGILHGYGFRQCVRCGVIAGSLSTRVLGGNNGDLTPAELDRWLRQE